MWVRIAGYRPFSSHAEKKNVQSMNLAISASGTSSRYRRPTNHGDAISCSSQSTRRRLARAFS
jgi:hypothetical protein